MKECFLYALDVVPVNVVLEHQNIFTLVSIVRTVFDLKTENL